MKYTIQGKGSVDLVNTDFMASGGEAKIFRKANTIYKIYHNPSDMIPDGKFYELQAIKNRNVRIPMDIILDSKKTRIGFTMEYVDHAEPLCKLFTNAYLEQNDISNDRIVDLIKFMQDTIKSIHDAKCIQVDGNELNYLVDNKTYNTAYFIDVNSYQTKSFPATVIMPSIRDWTAKTFNELTDWYSFAIIACQLLVGVHPYKGKHPDFKKFDIENRMKAHVSIFNKNVQVPQSARDFSRIPGNYMDWFTQILEGGKRIPPPSVIGKADAKVSYVMVVSTDSFRIKEVQSFDDTILFHSNLNRIPVTKTKKSISIGTSKYAADKDTYLVHSPRKLVPITVKIKDNSLELKSLDKFYTVANGSNINAEELLIIKDTIYVRSGESLLETSFIENNTTISLAIKNVWNIHKNASRFFKNMVVQDLLGSKYLAIPEPERSTFHNIKCAALDKYKILDGKYENGTCILSVSDTVDNTYKLVVIPNVTDMTTLRFINTSDYSPVNFVSLDNGVAIMLYEDTIEIFSRSSKNVKVIKDTQLHTNMTLCKQGTAVLFFTDNKLYNIQMK